MAVTISYAPSNYARVYDTNICSYLFTSTMTGQTNFTFYVEFFCNGIKIGQQKYYPTTNYVWINPTSIYKNFLSPSNQTYDINLAASGVTQCPNSIKSFFMMVYESYGTPPTNHFGVMTPTTYLYNGVLQFIDYQATAGGGNDQWYMNSGHTGGFLCDVNQIYMDDSDYYCLYFITNTPITSIQYTWDSGGGGTNKRPSDSNEIIPQSLTKGSPDAAYVPPPTPTGTTLVESEAVSINQIGMYYIPISMSRFRSKWSLPDNWRWFMVDLYNGTTKVNKTSFVVYFTKRDCRYPNYQVFWLNKHGGYDGMTWDKGNVVKNKIRRDTYKKSLFPNYNFQQAGELVHNIDVEEDFTLTTSLLDSQTQSQLIMGMFQSPVIFVLQNINGSLYTVPYICVDTDVQYLQMVNDQAIYYTCTLRPSNQKLEQTY